MKRIIISIATLTIIFNLIGCGGSPKGETLVIVGGSKITQADLDMLAIINPRLKAQMTSEFGKKKILDNLVEQEIFYQASVNEGFDKKPEVKDKIDIYKKVIIAQAYMDEKMKEEAKNYYDAHKNEFEKLKLSHIYIKFGDEKDKKGKNQQVRSEKDALDIANKAKKRIEAGEDFAVVAGEMSDDTMTSKRGGDLGFASKDEARLTRRGFGPVLEKAFTMKVGEVEGPIKTEEGYHIVTVTQGSEVQPFEEAEQAIMFKTKAESKNKIMADLKEKFKIKYETEDKKPAEKKSEKKVEKKDEKQEMGDKKQEAGSEKQEEVKK